MTSNAKAEGRFGKQDFRYVAEEDVYICPAGERLDLPLHQRRKWTGPAPLLDQRLSELRHQASVAPPARSDGSPAGSMSMFSRRCSAGSMSIRRRCASGARRSSIPSARIKARMGATHFLMKTLPRVAAEMALHVLAYNLTRVMNIMGIQPYDGRDEGIVSIRKINAPRQLRRPCVASPWVFLHNQDP